MKRILSFCALAALVVAPAFAQTTYTRTPGETLRYKQVQGQSMSMVTEQFEQNVDSDAEAILVVTFAEADTARAVYEALDLVMNTPAGKQEMNGMDMLTGGYTFIMSANGAVEVLESPTSATGQNVAPGVSDFFLELPEEPLAMGSTWSTTEETVPQPGLTNTTNITYTVTGEETMAGMTVWVIDVDGTNVIDGEISQMGQEAILNLEGTVTGAYYFSAENGIFVGGELTTDVDGGYDVEANGEVTMVEQAVKTTTRIELITE